MKVNLGVFIKELAFIGVLCVCFVGCTSKEEKERQQKERFDECVKQQVELCDKACRSDPKLVYCQTVTNGDVIGSGCTAKIDALSYPDKVNQCLKHVCEVYAEMDAITHCNQ